jgi:prepilin-type N-terminal cleavage/methylation domain-containing protein
MVGAHHLARGAVVRVHGRARVRARGGEAGFSIIELLVVMIIIAIILSMALPSLSGRREKTDGPQVNVAAGAVWRGIQAYRIENHGTLPPTNMVTSPSGSAFVNPGTSRYVRRWPDASDGSPIAVTAGTGNPPTARIAPGSAAAGNLVYSVSNGGRNGWLVGYASNGSIVFRRSIESTAAGVVPAG